MEKAHAYLVTGNIKHFLKRDFIVRIVRLISFSILNETICQSSELKI